MQPFKERLEELMRDTVAPLLIEKVMHVYNDQMTPQERADMDNGTFRLAKVILDGLDVTSLLDSQIGSETAQAEVKRIKRIRKRQV